MEVEGRAWGQWFAAAGGGKKGRSGLWREKNEGEEKKIRKKE